MYGSILEYLNFGFSGRCLPMTNSEVIGNRYLTAILQLDHVKRFNFLTFHFVASLLWCSMRNNIKNAQHLSPVK